ALLLHVGAGTDQDAVVVAPGREAQPRVDLQVLDGGQDVGAVSDDGAEQPAQGVAALVQDAAGVEDGAVDPAALEDADVLQLGALGGEQLSRVHLDGVDAVQLLDAGP